MYTSPKLERFEEHVASKYQIYNSMLITLPFDNVGNTGIMLPLFAEVCESGFKNEWKPQQIFDFFSEKYLDSASEQEKIDLMFRFIQYVERQIVLFDAIEDSAFAIINNLDGANSVRNTKERAESKNRMPELKSFFEDFKIRTVLTAHPTQFYPGSVLGIITDLEESITANDLKRIKELLAQLGKTPFIKKDKPTPFDEAVSLTWYLENVFYETAGNIMQYFQKNVFAGELLQNQIINFGFWPGGDRDGNPFVTNEITLRVTDRLRTSILKCYYNDIRQLKRKLTFAGVDTIWTELEHKIYRSVFYSKGELYITLDEMKATLMQIRERIISNHQSLYLDDLDKFINKVNLFGFYFATLDVRQNSKIHDGVFDEIEKVAKEENLNVYPENYDNLSESERLNVLMDAKSNLTAELFEDENAKSTIDSIYAIKTIQENNGEYGANRYIISNTQSAQHILETYALFGLCGWENPTVDIVPLFETVEDLHNAEKIMDMLYSNAKYFEHLKRRNGKQTIMLGFSDGTKDGGYLMANWSIYKAKEALTAISRKYDVEVIFFDGRGGPPARGGGKTHKFYASLGPDIENKEIQITIQGQTISSNFGTLDSCRFNLENLLSAGVANQVFYKGDNKLSDSEKEILEELSNVSYQEYSNFKNHPKFIPYLERRSALKYYSLANIGSRPSKRSKSDTLDFEDLRAIPFVGAWSQLKQNVPGFFGVGTALKHFEENGNWDKIQKLYNDSLFFKTLIENSMMSLAKSFFPLTAYMKEDEEFGEFWEIIFNEFKETKRLLLKISGFETLMENYPDGKASIQMREQIVLPLLTIQQYALSKINELNANENRDEELVKVYEKIVMRSLFGNINASRNSA
ncbi:phosphoenolpyruvate carboxylase [Flavobacterium macacae]|uniref:Phosphoenolpyruvate carboxylase n=1 Tax=Flavobacterium macacae TaxID=2488993 RepID=A0A3P3W1Z8_9FLAO|nr:phosphoenolpyruvate carboxylase [Flavobacterium macacae]RRJ89030.1 phosphoenolpyruvate carboxylase [Flavobacterium macacae]